jgi:putative membrane protein
VLLETRIPIRFIAQKVWREAIYVLLIATAVDAAVSLNREYLPPIQSAIPAFLGTAISLLLSFKLNQSYDRWWEARKIWGAIVNDSRTLVRQVSTLASEPSDTAVRIARRQIAWCYALGQSLRGLDWTVGAVEHLVEEDIAEAERHTNKPAALMHLHAVDVAKMAERGLISDFRRVAIDETLTRLVDAMGRAERIRTTVFPRTYRLFLHFFIYLFITILAIALAELEGAWAIGITTLIAVPFFLLEKTAVHMQDPFSNRPTDVSVTAIARTVEINIRETLGDSDVPPSLPTRGFYVM